VKKVLSIGSFLDKKYTKQNDVLRSYKTTEIEVTEEGDYEKITNFSLVFAASM
jgi:hypothetical protein